MGGSFFILYLIVVLIKYYTCFRTAIEKAFLYTSNKVWQFSFIFSFLL